MQNKEKKLIDNISQIKGISFDFRPIDPSQKAAEYQDVLTVVDHMLCIMHYTLFAKCQVVLRTYDEDNLYPEYSCVVLGRNMIVEGLIVFFNKEDYTEHLRLFEQEFGTDGDNQEDIFQAKMCQIFDQGAKNEKD